MRVVLATIVLTASLMDPGVGPTVLPGPDPEVLGRVNTIVGRPVVSGDGDPPGSTTVTDPEGPGVPTDGALVGEIRFCLNCSDLTRDDHEVLAHLASTLPVGSCVAVEGHADRTGRADPTGRAEDNMALSLDRADAVATVLVDRGMRVVPVGFGDLRPRGRGDEADRRVEIRYRLECAPEDTGPPRARPATP